LDWPACLPHHGQAETGDRRQETGVGAEGRPASCLLAPAPTEKGPTMGVMTFLLPDGVNADTRRELERSAVNGGPDNMPTPTDVAIGGGQLRVRRSADESGYLVAPWEIDGFGTLMGSTATLMERARPYSLLTELARGKVNQL